MRLCSRVSCIRVKHGRQHIACRQARDLWGLLVAAHESVGRTDVGRLVPGQLADLVAVDRDLWALEESSPSDIRDTVVLQTWVGGEIAYQRS